MLGAFFKWTFEKLTTFGMTENRADERPNRIIFFL